MNYVTPIVMTCAGLRVSPGRCSALTPTSFNAESPSNKVSDNRLHKSLLLLKTGLLGQDDTTKALYVAHKGIDVENNKDRD
jgi:hypothetical protein